MRRARESPPMLANLAAAGAKAALVQVRPSPCFAPDASMAACGPDGREN